MLVVHVPPPRNYPVMSNPFNQISKGYNAYNIMAREHDWVALISNWNSFFLGPTIASTKIIIYAINPDRVRHTRVGVDIHEVRIVVFLTPFRVKNIEGCRFVTDGLHTFGQGPFPCEELQHLIGLAWQVTHVEDISFHMIAVAFFCNVTCMDGQASILSHTC